MLLPLATIGFVELLALVLGGWLVLRLVNRGGACGRMRGTKLLGLAAIVAGVAVFWMRSDRHVVVDQAGPPMVDVLHDEHGFVERVEIDPWAEPLDVKHDRWVFVTLGSALVILGALLFARGGTRPVALKAVTVLGIGAIVYAVVTFVGQPPRPWRVAREGARFVHVEPPEPPRVIIREDMARDVSRDVTRRFSRARRPALRPERPGRDDPKQTREELPPRAGTIPVSAELEKEKPRPAPEPPSAAADVAAAAAPDAKPEPPAAAEVPEEPAKPTESPEREPAKDESAAAENPRPETPAPAERKEPESADPKPAPQPAVASSPPRGDEPRPEWVDAAPGLSGGVYTVTVASGPFASPPECQRALDEQMEQELGHYINDYLGEQAAAVVDIPLSYIKSRLKKAEFVEKVEPKTLGEMGLGHMYQIHARLEIDERARADFWRQWRSAEVTNRLWYTGGAAALVLALLGTLYGYLKLDVKTGGAHKGRLQLAATLVALIAAAGVLVVRWAVPF